MSLITLRQLLDEACLRKAAIPAFNVNNLEQIQAILEAAAYTNAPVILQTSLGARKYAGMPFLKHLMQGALESYPEMAICLHQDHGHEPKVCYEALAAGWSSVMMDGSLDPDGKTPATFASNVKRTAQVVEVAHSLGVSVEGELGCLGSLESGLAGEEDGSGAQGSLSHAQMLTDPAQAKEFIQRTRVDALAVAIGTSHGACKFIQTPNSETFALYRMKELYEFMPHQHFVLHGSSTVPHEIIAQINDYGGDLPYSYGVPLSLLQKSIRFGVRKINIDTDLRLACTAALRKFLQEHPTSFDPRQYMVQSKSAMKAVCVEKFEAFGCTGWGNKIDVLSLESMKLRYIDMEGDDDKEEMNRKKRRYIE